MKRCQKEEILYNAATDVSLESFFPIWIVKKHLNMFLSFLGQWLRVHIIELKVFHIYDQKT